VHRQNIWTASNFIHNTCREVTRGLCDYQVHIAYISEVTSLQFVIQVYCLFYLAGIMQSVQLLATGWTVRGSNPGGGDIFHTRPHRPCGPPSLLYNGYRVFLGGKAAGAWRWSPTPSSAEVKIRVELYLLPLSLIIIILILTIILNVLKCCTRSYCIFWDFLMYCTLKEI